MNTEIQTQCGIYIMTGTLDGDRLVKVGKTTVGVYRRLSQLNADCYAGISDWRLHTWFALDNARLTSAVEKIIHDEIERFNVPLPNGAGGMATEVFDIDPSDAGDALTAALSQMQGYVQLEAQLVGGSEYRPASQRRSMLGPIAAMIGLLAVVFSFAFTGNAKAADTDYCLKVSSMATSVMKARQQGAPMDKLIELARDPEWDAETQQGMIDVVVDAYDSPKFSTAKHQQQAITEFGADYLVSCLQGESL